MTAAAPAPSPLIGVWSGGRVTLTLTAAGGNLVDDCQETRLAAPITPDARGRFAATAQREIFDGGPQRADGPPAMRPVHITGQLTGGTLQLSVRSAQGATQDHALLPGRRIKRIGCY